MQKPFILNCFILLLLSCALCTLGFGQVPLPPSQYNGNPNRTLDLRDPAAGSIQKPLTFDTDKLKARNVAAPVVPKERSCATLEVEKDLNLKHVDETESPEQFEQWMQEAVKRNQKRRSLYRNSSPEIFSLPVVVHVVYSNSLENISDAQVLSQIDVLNQDYRRTNSDKSLTAREFRNIAVDTGIEFCMASVDPQGRPTNGIDRVSLSGSPFKETFINEQIKPSTIWDPSRYFNIWVINIAEGVLGFAQFPMSSGLTGIPQLPATSQSDGVVINYFAFGTMGTATEPFNKGRTATHEIGHWLGLRHVWGDGPCGVDDYCPDTPETLEANFGCPASVIGCNGKRAMVQNFMEYTNDACMNLFTRDQRARMRTVLQNSPRRASLLRSNACKAVVAPPKADFVADVQSGCGPLKVQFTNQSKGQGSKYFWTFEGGRPSTSDKTNPIVRFAKPGKYPVSLRVSNDGGSDVKTEVGFIEVREGGQALPFALNFEQANPLGEGTRIFNSQGDNIHTWVAEPGISAGGRGTQAIGINNHDNQEIGNTNWLLTPIVDLSGSMEPVLSFKLAYARHSRRYSDTLGVFISTGCGTLFHNIYYRGGEDLSTLGEDLSTPFMPRSQEWRTEMIDLSQYIGQSHLQIAFVNFNGHGNSLFLDEIYVGEKPTPPPVAAFTISDTGLCAGDQISFMDQSLHQPTQWIWSFEGGMPASDTTRNPNVRYPEPGLYTVKLTVRSETGENTLEKESVIFVKPKPDLRLTASKTEICAGQEIRLLVQGREDLSLDWTETSGVLLSDEREVTLALQENARFEVRGTDRDGCEAVSAVSVQVLEGETMTITPPASTICEGSSVQLRASGASNYSWSPSEGLNRTSGATVQANPIRTTTYTVTGRTPSGCTLRKMITITVDPAPNLLVEADRESICPGLNATLKASGAASYRWTPASGLNQTEGEQVVAAPSRSTTYVITGTSPSGCSITKEQTILVGLMPRISVGTNQAEICEGEQVEFRARGGVRYEWTPEVGLNNNKGPLVIANPKVSSRYTVTGWNEDGCSDTASVGILVSPKPPLEILVSNPSICRGNSSLLEAVAPTATSFRWRPRAGLSATNRAAVTASPRKSTTYTLDIVDASGCSNQASTTISISRGQRPRAAFFAEETAACLGQEVQFRSQSEFAVEYLWEFPGGDPSFSREANPKVRFLDTGPQDVSLTVVGCNGDQDKVEVEGFLSVSSPFDLRLNTAGKIICKGQSVELEAFGAVDYSWSPASGLDVSEGQFVIATPSTTTTYTVTASDRDGCLAKKEVVLEVVGEGGSLNIQPFSPSICEGESLLLSARGASSYFWIPTNGLERGRSSRVQVAPTATTTFVVQGTTEAGCTLRDSVEVTVRKRVPLVVSPGVANICPGEQVNLRLNQKGLFRWSPAEGLSAASGTEVVAFPQRTTTYTITGTDEYGCENDAEITVGVGVGGSLQVQAQDSIICQGETTLLTAMGSNGYQWFPADGLDKTTGPIVSARPEKTTTYTVSTLEGGCGSQRNVTVVVRPPKAIQITPAAPSFV